MNEQQHFNEAAKNWDSEEAIKRNVAFAGAMKRYLPSSTKRLLDFGCGTGLLSSHFLNDASDVLGVDTSEGMLQELKRKYGHHPQVRTLNWNLEQSPLPTEEKSFDVIMTAMAFHHLNEPKEMLKYFKKILRPGGRVFVIDLDQEDGTFHPDNKAMGVKHFGFSKDELMKWATETDLHFFHHEIVFQIEKNNRSYGIAMAVFQ